MRLSFLSCLGPRKLHSQNLVDSGGRWWGSGAGPANELSPFRDFIRAGLCARLPCVFKGTWQISRPALPVSWRSFPNLFPTHQAAPTTPHAMEALTGEKLPTAEQLLLLGTQSSLCARECVPVWMGNVCAVSTCPCLSAVEGHHGHL